MASEIEWVSTHKGTRWTYTLGTYVARVHFSAQSKKWEWWTEGFPKKAFSTPFFPSGESQDVENAKTRALEALAKQLPDEIARLSNALDTLLRELL